MRTDTTNVPTTAEEGFAAIRRLLNQSNQIEMQFIPTRYPYTYAYDYVRERSVTGSRHDAGLWVRRVADITAMPVETLVEIFADAYLRQYNIQRPAQELAAA